MTIDELRAWRDEIPPDGKKVIECTKEAMVANGSLFGTDLLILTESDLRAMRAGRLLAVDEAGGEYVMFIALEPEPGAATP